MNLPVYTVLFLFVTGCPNEATLITKFLRAYTDYGKRYVTVYRQEHPLEKFTSRQRQILCDVVIKANKYVLYEPRSKVLRYIPYEWEFVNTSANYQRIKRTSIKHPAFEYIPTLTFTNRKYMFVKLLYCVHTAQVQWAVTFGLENKFIYLLEHVINRRNKILQVNAMVEPTPLFSSSNTNLLSDYLWNQLKSLPVTSHEVNKVLCSLDRNDHMRLCSSAFDILTSKGYFQDSIKQINYVTTPYTRCTRKNVYFWRTSGLSEMEILPCSINKEDTSPQFYALADPGEHAAVFILLPVLYPAKSVTISMHIRKIGALLNPMKSKHYD